MREEPLGSIRMLYLMNILIRQGRRRRRREEEGEGETNSETQITLRVGHSNNTEQRVKEMLQEDRQVD